MIHGLYAFLILATLIRHAKVTTYLTFAPAHSRRSFLSDFTRLIEEYVAYKKRKIGWKFGFVHDTHFYDAHLDTH